MQDSQAIIVSAQLKKNTEQLQKQGETFVQAMERLADQIDKRFEKVNQQLADMQKEIRDVKNEMRQLKKDKTDKRASPTRLSVTMPDGMVIEYKDAADTFVTVIDKIGRKDVKILDLKVSGTDLMSTSEDGLPRRKLGGYYIHVGTSTKKKASLLAEIDSRLDVGLWVEIIPK
ncbi:hypothetical protein C6502_01310 [Candidatus Poribacteria bacterium]|nr:MAG: hypothetical protein C6502_01310 [Candidatus Poribacteria bacterium]